MCCRLVGFEAADPRSGGNDETWAGTNDVADLRKYGWFWVNSEDKTHPVGSKRPNALGLYDMSGNVLEWCEDRYTEDYYSNSGAWNPAGPDSGAFRVLRGGSWFNNDGDLRTTARDKNSPDGRYTLNGFRICVSAQ